MNPKAFKMISDFRIRHGAFASDDSYGNNGMWVFRRLSKQKQIRVMASDEAGWDHVSVSLSHRVPTWDEMCWIKNIFWRIDECAMQLHPPTALYVNNNPNVLHLWKPQKEVIPMPPIIMV